MNLNSILPIPFNQIPAKFCKTRKFAPGEKIFLQDQKTRGLFYIISGKVELVRFTAQGQLVLIHRANSSETFAEASLFSGQYHCDANATEKCEIIEINRHAVLMLIDSKPDFALAISKRFAIQNQFYRRRIEILAIRNAEERIYAAVIDHMMGPNISTFAADLHLSPEAVYRGLAKLVAKNKLKKTSRGTYAIN